MTTFAAFVCSLSEATFLVVLLPQPFQHALDVVTAELGQRSDLAGLLFFGSAARGEARAGSDLDLYAVTAQASSGSLGRVLAAVPIEISFGSVALWTALIRNERPTVVHAFATGHLLLDDTEGALAALCTEARGLWARGPSPLTTAATLRFRFHLTDLVRDLEAMPEESVATALVASAGVRLALEALCAAERIWMPSLRSVLSALDRHAADIAALVRQCAERGFPGSLAAQVADRVLERLGGRLHSYDTYEPARD